MQMTGWALEPGELVADETPEIGVDQELQVAALECQAIGGLEILVDFPQRTYLPARRVLREDDQGGSIPAWDQ